MPKLEPYDRKLGYSYALGVFPSLKLLEYRPQWVRRLLLSEEGLKSEGVDKLRQACAALGVREEFADRVLRRESQKDNCFAGLVFEKYPQALSPDRPQVVLCQISDVGNLGTALRTCLGFGIRDVALVRRCVDPWEPHALRSSMGAFYAMNVAVYDDFDDWRRQHPDHELYPFMLDGAIDLNRAAARRGEKYALIFGNEASGLPARFSALGQSVLIPQSDEIDSLNLAVAVSIGVYTFTRPYHLREGQSNG